MKKITNSIAVSILGALLMCFAACEIQTPEIPDDDDKGKTETPETPLTNREGVALTQGEGTYFDNFYENETGRFLVGLYSDDFAMSGQSVTNGTVVRVELLSEIAPDEKFPTLAAGTYTLGDSKAKFTGLPGDYSYVISTEAAVADDVASGTVKVFRNGKRYGFEFVLVLADGRQVEAWYEGTCGMFNDKYISMLQDDVDFPGLASTTNFGYYGDAYGAGSHTWSVLTWDSSRLTMDKTTGVLTGKSGVVLQFEIYTTQQSSPHVPAGTYQILQGSFGAAGAVLGGRKRLNQSGTMMQEGARYMLVTDGGYTEQAPLTSGTIKVAYDYDADTCTFTVDAVDDLGFRITGDMTGKFTLSDQQQDPFMPF